MVRVKKAAKSGGKSRTRRHRTSAGPSPKPFARSLDTRYALDADDEDELFTLHDVARQTGSHQSERFNANSQLRKHAINFVKSTESLRGTLHDAEEERGMEDAKSLPPKSNHTRPTSNDDNISNGTERAASPTPSNSSDEIVLFSGRTKAADRARLTRSPFKEAQFRNRLEISSGVDAHQESPAASATHLHTPLVDAGGAACSVEDDASMDKSTSFGLKDQVARPRAQLTNAIHTDPKTRHRSPKELDASLADYMQNMWTHGELDDDFVLQASTINQDTDGWDASDIADFDCLSTSEETGEEIELVLAKRQRPSGQQYLIVRQGQLVDEARWIRQEALSTTAALKLLQQFEEEEGLTRELATSTSNDSTDENAHQADEFAEFSDEEIDDSQEDDDDEILKEERAMMRMADEQIARLLSKQEELGMGSEELLLFDDPDYEMDEAGLTEDFLRTDRSRSTRNTMRRKSSRGRGHGRYFNLSDDPPGDDYGSFDVMDFDRPSLGNTFKGTKELLFNLSDSELEAELREQFAADRKKKGAKKQEREELRAQGLLGKKNKFKPDLGLRYNDGLSLSQLKHEMEEFLFNDSLTLSLPPMGKSERKVIHEIANQFNLKSKSIGSGKSRFPQLHKTSRTIHYDATLFNRLEKKLHGRFLPRLDKRAKGKGLSSGRRGGGNGISSGTGYAEGETVGASAPELGSDNRGRAMLEKMGWSTGMALGALDNKGILQPIPHIVKKTRAGLG